MSLLLLPFCVLLLETELNKSSSSSSSSNSPPPPPPVLTGSLLESEEVRVGFLVSGFSSDLTEAVNKSSSSPVRRNNYKGKEKPSDFPLIDD